MNTERTGKIGFQGAKGANSEIAIREVYPSMEAIACDTFEDVFNALNAGEIELAMIPIENTIAGRVADIHHLLPESKLHIIGEYFLPIHFQLMALPGVARKEIKTVHSHIHALGQCRKVIRKHRWKAMVAGDTAGAAKLVAETGMRERECRIIATSTLDKVRSLIQADDLTAVPKLGSFHKRPGEGAENRYVFKLKA